MLGPLPTVYKVIVSAIAFLAFVGLGSWITLVLPESALAGIGTDLGIGLGALVVVLLLFHHDPHQRSRAGVPDRRS